MPERHLRDCFREMEPSPEDLADPNFGKFGRYCEQIGGRRFFMPTNRFQRNSRLGQIYLVDQMSRAIDFRLDYHRNSEGHIFGGQSRSSPVADDSDDEGEQYGDDDQGADYQGLDPRSRPTFLSDSFTGSKRHASTPRQLRGLFVTLALNAFPVLVIFRNDVLCNQMLEITWIDNPRYDDPEVDRRLATEKLLCDLRDRFAEHGKTNTDYGLPEPADSSTELQRYQLHFGNVAEQARLYADLKAAKPLNAQQQHVFDVITAAILS